VPFPGEYWKDSAFISEHERKNWVDEMINIAEAYHYNRLCTIHSVHLFDDFIAKVSREPNITSAALELYALTCLWIMGKYSEPHSIPLTHLVKLTQDRYTRDQFIDAEEYILTTLKFRVIRRPPLRGLNSKSSPIVLKQVLPSPLYAKGEFTKKISDRLNK
jgi:hypothetical protein